MPETAPPLTRLDKAIRRLMAQRACLDWAAAEIATVEGVVIELGLGNGRSYDHLRARLPGRDIFVFERCPQAHPDATPPPDRLILGAIEETLTAAQPRFSAGAALIHSDIGTGDDAHNRRIAAWLGPRIRPFLAPGAILASDQDLTGLADLAIPPPAGVGAGRYFIYRLPAPRG